MFNCLHKDNDTTYKYLGLLNCILLFVLCTIAVLRVSVTDVVASSHQIENIDSAPVEYEIRLKVTSQPVQVIAANEKNFVKAAAKLISQHEGFSAKVYRDSKNQWAQGFGRRIYNPSNKVISKQTAQVWLRADIRKVMRGLDREFPWWRTMSTVRQLALVDMTYNVGVAGLYGFKNFREALVNGDYDRAAHELQFTGERNTKYWNQVGYRAEKVAQAFATNKWS